MKSALLYISICFIAHSIIPWKDMSDGGRFFFVITGSLAFVCWYGIFN